MTFQKGQSGNPAGRKKNQPLLTPTLRQLVAKDGNKEKIAEVLVRLALAGDLDAIKIILDRIDGKVVAPVEVSGPNSGPIEIEALDYRQAIAALAPAEARPVGD